MLEMPPELQSKLLGYATSLLGVIVLLSAVWILGGVTRRATLRALKRVEFDETLAKFFSNMARWTVLLMGVLAAMNIFGIEPTSFAAVLGGAGLAIGLAFSGTLGNFASGVMLLTFRPFKVGDVVNVAGVIGKVNEIELFTTTLDTPDNRRFILPNGSVFGQTIENISYHSTRRVEVAVGCDYSADVDRTRQILERAAREIPDVLDDPEPQVVLVDLGASSVDWVVRIWVVSADFFAVKEACTRCIKLALDEAGIGIPFPQMDVHLDRTDPAQTPQA